MPIQHAIWKVGSKPEPLVASKLASEKSLEEMIVQCPAILSAEWMLIGRQEKTQFGGIIDLLAIAPDGSLVLIELKRDKTPRDIVAQSLDYASWVEGLAAEKIAQIYERFPNSGGFTVKKYHSAKSVTEDGWKHEQIELLPLNPDYDPIIVSPHESPEMVVVGEWASSID